MYAALIGKGWREDTHVTEMLAEKDCGSSRWG